MAPGLFTTLSFLTSEENNLVTFLQNNDSTGASVSIVGNEGESTKDKKITSIVTTFEDNTNDLSSSDSTILNTTIYTTISDSSIRSSVPGGSKTILSSSEASTMGPSTGTTGVGTTGGGTPGETASESNTAPVTANGNGHSEKINIFLNTNLRKKYIHLLQAYQLYHHTLCLSCLHHQ